MSVLIYVELQKLFKKWRTYIGFIAVIVLVAIIQTTLYLQGENYINMLTRSFKNQFIISGNLLNGYLIANMILNFLFVHIPFLIVIVGGDMIAGEATAGTFRMLVTRPVSRFQIITAKFIAGNIYVFTMVVLLAALSLGVSLIIFGSGELIVTSNGISFLTGDDILWRFWGAYASAFISLSAVFGLAFFFSSFVENALGPIVASMSVIIVFFILSTLDLEYIRDIRPYLFTTYMGSWGEFFVEEVDFAEVYKAWGVFIAHAAAFYMAALLIFKRKDILS